MGGISGMTNKGPSVKELTQMINSVLGQSVLTEQQMNHILQGAKKAHQQGGMGAVLDYLMKVTQADVSKQELKQFADSIRSNPKVGMDILQGRRSPGTVGRKRRK
ncbi:hypothetical protein PLACP1_02290 [Planifilum fimeticola]|jgi:hypothetical protein